MTTCYWPIHNGDHHQDSDQPDWMARLSNFWHGLFTTLAVSTEPRVWQTRSASGQPTWNAYHALTGRAIYRVSENDLRIWLEELHYYS
jgi:hypothetical protein